MNLTRRFTLAVFILLIASGVRATAQSLDGVWEITAVIDNGRVIEPTEVLQNYAADGRVVIASDKFFVPAEREASQDQRHLALRVYSYSVR